MTLNMTIVIVSFSIRILMHDHQNDDDNYFFISFMDIHEGIQLLYPLIIFGTYTVMSGQDCVIHSSSSLIIIFSSDALS